MAMALDPRVMADAGLTTLLDASGKEAFAGKSLGGMSLINGERVLGMGLPPAMEETGMRSALREAGWEPPPEAALIYAVAG